MNLAPKVGPLVAELLSGLAALLLIYFHVHGFSFEGIENLPSGAIILLAALAWISGTFFDLIRNLFEWVWDCPWITRQKLNWRFFFSGPPEHLANLEHYFWSFYLLDADMAIAILLSLLLSRVFIPNGHLDLLWSLGFAFVAVLFAVDVILLRIEIKDLLNGEPRNS